MLTDTNLIDAINRQTEAIERLARNFERVFGTGLEKSAVKIAAMSPEQRKQHNKQVLAEGWAKQGGRGKRGA